MNQKPKLGIDIDGTVTCPKAFVPYLQRDFNQQLKYEDITEYNLANVLNCKEEEMLSWFKNNESHIYQHSPVAEGAKDILTQLKDDYELYYISARHHYLEDITKEWFQSHHIPFDQITLTGSHNKLEVTKEQNIDIFFEDKLDNAEDINHYLNIPVFLFDTPYNQKDLQNGIYRIKTWHEVSTLLNRI
ncbi:5' nucleotidase, NT5C type [Mammaliicoccus sciuri]|uniref:5' nucleotidase, NT5C type n=1 Tax=Mammaliicoccus sciuri TaxID=1296 RepID=UPI003D12FFB9